MWQSKSLKSGKLALRLLRSYPNYKWANTINMLQFSSVAQSCLTLCDPKNHNTLDIPVYHQLTPRSSLKLMSIESVMPFSHLILCRAFFSCPQSLQASGSFPMSQLFASGGQRIGVSTSTSSFQGTPRTDLL